MQGRARGRKGECKTYHINPYHHITMEFGGYLLNVAKPHARKSAQGRSARGPILPKSNRNFRQPSHLSFRSAWDVGMVARGSGREMIHCVDDCPMVQATVSMLNLSSDA